MRSDWDLIPRRNEPRRTDWDVLPRGRQPRGLVAAVCAVTLALVAAVIGMAPDEGGSVAARTDDLAIAALVDNGAPAPAAPLAAVPSEGNNASPAAVGVPTSAAPANPAPVASEVAAAPGPPAAPTPPAQPDTHAGEPPKPGDVPGEWIVELNAGESPDEVADDHDGEVHHVYTAAVDGYAASMTDEEAEQVASDPRVARVTRDRVAYATAQILPTGIKRIGAPTVGTGGSVNVDVAVVDTGISSHADLNVAGGKNCNGWGSSYADRSGHGTHVAGTIGARNDANGVVGVAPGARLWAVRVLGNNGSGTFSQIVCGLDWVRAQGNIEVVNMSLSGSGTDGSCGNSTFHNAVCNLKNAGTTIVVAAGNSSADASGEVPAAYEQVITVSALADFNGLAGGGAAPTCRSDVDDTFANFSNYGSDVDLIAPGVCILSTSRTGGTTTMSGTSMAAPHVAGAAGLYKASNPSATPDEVRSALIAAGNSNWNDADDPDSTKEPLLAVGTVGGVTPAEEPPTPNFTFSCTNLACNFTDTSTATDGDAITGQLWEFGSGGATSTAQNPTFNYPSGGTYAVKLTVTDNDGSDSITKNVTVTAAETQVPPTPNFTFSCTNLTCSFTDTSATTNGDAITSRSWSFGSGGATSTAQNPSFTYPSDGTYSVQLTVADNDGSASVTKSVTVTAPLPVNIQLSVSKSGWWYWINANLSWNGATGSSVDVHRRPSSSSTWTLITTTANDGSYSERPGSGTWVYRVCLQGSTTTCSNEATVSI